MLVTILVVASIALAAAAPLLAVTQQSAIQTRLDEPLLDLRERMDNAPIGAMVPFDAFTPASQVAGILVGGLEWSTSQGTTLAISTYDSGCPAEVRAVEFGSIRLQSLACIAGQSNENCGVADNCLVLEDYDVRSGLATPVDFTVSGQTIQFQDDGGHYRLRFVDSAGTENEPTVAALVTILRPQAFGWTGSLRGVLLDGANVLFTGANQGGYPVEATTLRIYDFEPQSYLQESGRFHLEGALRVGSADGPDQAQWFFQGSEAEPACRLVTNTYASGNPCVPAGRAAYVSLDPAQLPILEVVHVARA